MLQLHFQVSQNSETKSRKDSSIFSDSSTLSENVNSDNISEDLTPANVSELTEGAAEKLPDDKNCVYFYQGMYDLYTFIYRYIVLLFYSFSNV